MPTNQRGSWRHDLPQRAVAIQAALTRMTQDESRFARIGCEAKKLVLLAPFERQGGQPLQALDGKICGLAPCEDRLDDVGAETGERQKAADLCWIEAIIGCQGFERNDLPGHQLLHPFV
jgi:hypothetical protein